MSVKTSVFSDLVVRSFVEAVTGSNTYVFGADPSGSSASVNSVLSARDFLANTVFGVRVEESDVSYMVDNEVWLSGTSYTMYDDISDVSDSNYYVVVEPAPGDISDYHVYKCLFNNNGGTSTVKPVFDDAVNQLDGVYSLSDGYIWKYMYTVEYATAQRFKTRDKFPVIPSDVAANTAVDGGVLVVQVDNYLTNFGYELVEGRITGFNSNNRIEVSAFTDSTFEDNVDYYLGMSVYVMKKVSGDLVGADTYRIVHSGKNELGVTYVDVATMLGSLITPEKDDEFIILPTVSITGDGTGAKAIPVFDSTGARISRVQVISYGEGYTSAEAIVVDPVAFNERVGAVRASIRPVLAPSGGHGSDPVSELSVSDVCVSARISSNGTDVPSMGTYSKLGIVRSPEFTPNTAPDTFDNRVRIELESVGTISVGSSVSQTSGTETVTGVVREISGNTLLVTGYNGSHSIQFVDSLPLTFESVDLNIVDVAYPVYEQGTGDVLFMTDFSPITRHEDKEELIKVLIDF